MAYWADLRTGAHEWMRIECLGLIQLGITGDWTVGVALTLLLAGIILLSPIPP